MNLTKISILVCLFLFAIEAHAQVGIDTEDPQQQLHVSGESSELDDTGLVGPTIRIDGLSATNNAAFTATEDYQPVFVNSDGDLRLAPSGYGYKVGSNAVDDDLAAIIAIFYSTGTVTRNLGIYDFNLPTQCLVHFNKTISLNFALNATTPLSDGIPRFADVEYVISQAPTNSLVGKRIAKDGASYTSTDVLSPSGYLFLTGSESVILPAGNYRVRLNVRLFANPAESDQNFMVQVGGDRDEVSIIAEPFLY